MNWKKHAKIPNKQNDMKPDLVTAITTRKHGFDVVTRAGGDRRYSRRGFIGTSLAATAAAPLFAATQALAEEATTPQTALAPPKPERKIKIGLVGCGGRGAWIAKLFQQHGGYEFIAVADYFQKTADACGAVLGVDAARRFCGLSGYKRVLESGIEAVALEVPPFFFPDQAAAAVAAGLHVYMAKPVAVDVPGVLTIEGAARRATSAKRVFLVDYQMPTDPENAEVLRLIRADEIGPVQMIDSHYFADCFPDPPKSANIESRLQRLVWVNDTDIGGSYHVNACIHAVQAGWLVAGRRPLSASGVSRIARPDPHGDSHDVFAITYEFEDGLVWCHRGKHINNHTGFDTACQVQGRTGHAQIGYGGRAFLKSDDNAHQGEVLNLYKAGAVRNIAKFHRQVTTGDSTNDTVAGAVDSALITILGREACLRRTKLTMAALLKENQRFEVDLRGLKA